MSIVDAQKLERISPELAGLLRKVRTIHTVTGGGAESAAGASAALDTFDGMRGHINSRLNRLEELIGERDGLPKGTREHIMIKNRVNIELNGIQSDVQQLIKIHQRDAQKAKKRTGRMAPDELARRKDDIDAISNLFKVLFTKAKGHSHGVDVGGAGAAAGAHEITLEQLESDDALPGTRVRQQEMTARDQAMLQQIHSANAAQDELLDDIMAGLQDLKVQAEGIRDELTEQNMALKEVEETVDATQERLDTLNERMQKALDMVNDKATNFCAYAVCCIILLGLLTVVYNMATGK
jgi:DNA repair exonuclease SbcCD ATPase subunit